MLKLEQSFKDYFWNEIKVKSEYEKQSDLDTIAASWRLSNHPARSGIVTNSMYAGKTFIEHLKKGRKKQFFS